MYLAIIGTLCHHAIVEDNKYHLKTYKYTVGMSQFFERLHIVGSDRMT